MDLTNKIKQLLSARFSERGFIKTKTIIALFITAAAIAALSITYEIHESKNDALQLMRRQSETLLEITLASSQKALMSYSMVHKELKNRLFNNITLISNFYESGIRDKKVYLKITQSNNINSVFIFTKKGAEIFSISNKSDSVSHSKIKEVIAPIIEKITDSNLAAYRTNADNIDFNFIAAAISKEFIIAVEIRANEFLDYRKSVGVGPLLRKLTVNQSIIYAVLQNEDGIIAGSGILDNLEEIEDSEALIDVYESEEFRWRIIENDSLRVFEALRVFEYNGEHMGIFRLGLSLEPLDNINEELTERIIYFGIVLFFSDLQLLDLFF